MPTAPTCAATCPDLPDLPDLRDLPDRCLAEPWEMPRDTQEEVFSTPSLLTKTKAPWEMPRDTQEEVGCVIGTDYPWPMVDHREARQEALERYRV